MSEASTDRASEVLRLLDRYFVEVVEAFGLCPWAKSARLGGEVTRAIVWGERPAIDAFVAAGEALLARPETRVAMVVAPEYAGTLGELRDVRAEVARRLPAAGIAEFHPDADLDLATPARLVRFLRRSPDPLLQLVPLAILASVRTADRVVVDTLDQAQLLAGAPLDLPVDIADRIADTNHATVRANPDAIVAALAAIDDDRDASYARVGISTSRRRR